ncbi:unnamed protein product, partial [Pylaiella littoralis]
MVRWWRNKKRRVGGETKKRRVGGETERGVLVKKRKRRLLRREDGLCRFGHPSCSHPLHRSSATPAEIQAQSRGGFACAAFFFTGVLFFPPPSARMSLLVCGSSIYSWEISEVSSSITEYFPRFLLCDGMGFLP